MKHHAIPMKPCQSSALTAHGYHPETQTLAVQFKQGGPVYHLSGVPPELYGKFEQAKSLGGFFATHIRGKFGDPVKIDPRPA